MSNTNTHTEHLTVTVAVNHTPHELFAAITNVRGWWNENIIGDTAALHDEFVFTDDNKYAGETRHKDGIRYARFRLTEVIPGRRMVWHVVDSVLTFIEDHDEWTDTDGIFDLEATPQGTVLHFTHKGLTPAKSECFEACSRGWAFYLTKSLPQLLTTGTGQPYAKYHS